MDFLACLLSAKSVSSQMHYSFTEVGVRETTPFSCGLVSSVSVPGWQSSEGYTWYNKL